MKPEDDDKRFNRLYWWSIWAMVIFLMLRWTGVIPKAAPYVPIN